MTSSTPDALWSAPSARLLRPAGIAWTNLDRGRLLTGCSLAVPVGARVLIASEPEASGSVLLRILAGLSPSRRGKIQIAGMRHGWERRVGYLGPDPGVRSWMTPRETLWLAADLLGLAAPDARRRIVDVLAWSRISAGDADVPVRRGGPALRQRTGLAAALLDDPEVLLLDEPLRAIDAAERRSLLRFPGRRRTVLLASRYPASEAGLVSHVALLRAGRFAMLAPANDLAAAGLPLSMQGIVALAELRAATAGAEPRRRSSITAP